MGQDRKYTEEQRLFALRTVKHFRDKWEAVEKENLEHDVNGKLEREEPDKYYLEHHQEQDNNEINRIAEDEIANRAVPLEGEEPITEEEKHLIGLKSKFVQTTRTFFAPDLAAQYRAK